MEGREGPGKSCLRGALAEIMILYVMSATEKVIRIVKNKLPHPIFGFLMPLWWKKQKELEK